MKLLLIAYLIYKFVLYLKTDITVTGILWRAFGLAVIIPIIGGV